MFASQAGRRKDTRAAAGESGSMPTTHQASAFVHRHRVLDHVLRPLTLAVVLLAAGLAVAAFTEVSSPSVLDEPLLTQVQAMDESEAHSTAWFFNRYLRDTGIPMLWTLSI